MKNATSLSSVVLWTSESFNGVRLIVESSLWLNAAIRHADLSCTYKPILATTEANWSGSEVQAWADEFTAKCNEIDLEFTAVAFDEQDPLQVSTPSKNNLLGPRFPTWIVSCYFTTWLRFSDGLEVRSDYRCNDLANAIQPDAARNRVSFAHFPHRICPLYRCISPEANSKSTRGVLRQGLRYETANTTRSDQRYACHWPENWMEDHHLLSAWWISALRSMIGLRKF